MVGKQVAKTVRDRFPERGRQLLKRGRVGGLRENERDGKMTESESGRRRPFRYMCTYDRVELGDIVRSGKES